MNYTVNDAVDILYMCWFETVQDLLNLLRKGGFEVGERALEKKVQILKSGHVVEDQRKYNGREIYLNQNQLKKVKTELEKLYNLQLLN